MSNINIVEVESKGQLKQFIRYPSTLYRDESNYVVPLMSERLEFFDKEKNPFYRSARVKMFLATKNGEVCGRIATCINFRHNEYHDEQAGFFGFFDTPDDFEIASKLLKVAMITLKKEGAAVMRGPMNFSTNHEVGFLVEGFDSLPCIMMTYNYPYQPHLAEKFGLKKAMDVLAFKKQVSTGIPERLARIVERMRKRSKITIRTLNMSDFDNEITRVLEVYNGAWAPNWGFVPMNETEFRHMAKDMKQILDPSLVFIAEHEGRPVAFSLALPNINQALTYLNGKLFPTGLAKLIWHTKVRNKVDSLRLITFGVIKEFQKIGIDSLMFIETFKAGSGAGYQWAELSWILETNELMCRAAVGMGAEAYKRYRIMEMPL